MADILGMGRNSKVVEPEPGVDKICHRFFDGIPFEAPPIAAGQPPRVGSSIFNIKCHGAKCMMWDDKRKMCADRSMLEETRESNEKRTSDVKAFIEMFGKAVHGQFGKGLDAPAGPESVPAS